ncbi:hypothetical protein D3C85_1502320 [compost metagenome]
MQLPSRFREFQAVKAEQVDAGLAVPRECDGQRVVGHDFPVDMLAGVHAGGINQQWVFLRVIVGGTGCPQPDHRKVIVLAAKAFALSQLLTIFATQ